MNYISCGFIPASGFYVAKAVIIIRHGFNFFNAFSKRINRTQAELLMMPAGGIGPASQIKQWSLEAMFVSFPGVFKPC